MLDWGKCKGRDRKTWRECVKKLKVHLHGKEHLLITKGLLCQGMPNEFTRIYQDFTRIHP